MTFSRYRRLALGMSVVAVAACLSVPSASGADPAIRTGTFDGQWHSDKAQYTIDTVKADGSFWGSATLLDGTNKGYVITFYGVLFRPQGFTMTLNRTDKYPSGDHVGWVIYQTSFAGSPTRYARANPDGSSGQGYEWRGRTQGAGIPAEQEYVFSLVVPDL